MITRGAGVGLTCPGSATTNETPHARVRSSSDDFAQDISAKEAFGDDFDDFEDGAEADDEFGEFGDDLEKEPTAEDEPQPIYDEPSIQFVSRQHPYNCLILRFGLKCL